ncbi:MAG: Asp-tRNA(Asn)/Glu-tRNA(Gln) amidotransferase GatCAB subunit A, partial [Acidobacteriota bacterium]|nr:Asp-tRNA(Asn)/Glu-tRNA(Gln) amidotransferase GatCAB subunit A [Acidobacteriota bacterium]
MRTATQIAADVRAGLTTATEELALSLAAIGARNEELHVFLHVDESGAAAAAAAVDDAVARGEDPGPLAGVPVALKDNMCQRGVPTTCSSRILEGWRPPYSATVVD